MEIDNENENNDESNAYKTLSKIYKYITISEENMSTSFFNPVIYKRSKIYKILRKDYNINYQIPQNSPVALNNQNITGGSTALHIAAIHGKLYFFMSLLDLGADFTIKDSEGLTALHWLVKDIYSNEKYTFEFEGADEIPLVNILLNKHVHTQNSQNPKWTDGFSHFHVACMANKIDAMKFFLNSGESVNQKVNEKSRFAPGFTPLHFAVKHCNVDAIEILLENGADKNLKNIEGITPLQQLVMYKMKIIKDMKIDKLSQDLNLTKLLLELENAIEVFIETGFHNFACSIDDIGLTYLHLACIQMNKMLNEKCIINNINAAIIFESLVCPGFTPLHFAAYFNIDTVIYLLDHGADILTKNAEGLMPLDICLDVYDLANIKRIFVSNEILRNIQLSDGTKLIDVIPLMNSEDLFDAFLKSKDVNIHISLDSPIWQGYNMLHVAVMFTQKIKCIINREERAEKTSPLLKRKLDTSFTLTNLCLQNGFDFTIQAANGLTPLHLAFRHKKDSIIEDILNYHSVKLWNPVDSEGISHFHIATYNLHTVLVKQLLSTGVDGNHPIKMNLKCNDREDESEIILESGSTALHIAVAMQFISTNCTARTLSNLLVHNADPMIKNADGLTPLDLAFVLTDKFLMKLLFSDQRVLKENIVLKNGLSYFHAACYVDHVEAVESYLKLGVDVNNSITNNLTEVYDTNKIKLTHEKKDFWNEHLGCTPLHFAVSGASERIVSLLIDNGADVFARNKRKLTPIHLALHNCIDRNHKSAQLCQKILVAFLTKLQNDNLKLMQDVGVTLLHVACTALNVNMVKNLLKSGIDVDARTDDSSPISSGNTALHLLMIIKNNYRYDNQTITDLIQLLLEYGADVTIKNKEGNSPIHIAYVRVTDVHISDYASNNPADYKIVDLLLQHQRNYQINPTDNQGLSHFHIACSRNSLKIVEKFMQNYVNINQKTDYFLERYGGFSPLDFAVRFSNNNNIIQLLLLNRADANTRDNTDSTLLHQVVEHLELNLEKIETILSINKNNINEQNILGETPLEVLISRRADRRHYNFLTKPAIPIVKNITSMFISHGALLNIYNPVSHEGLLAKVVDYFSGHKRCFTDIICKTNDLGRLDEDTGGNAIHNVASLCIDFFNQDYYTYVIDFLTTRGIELEHRDNKGRTPLHTSVQHKNFNVLHSLLNLGVDINIEDDIGRTALEYFGFSQIYITSEAGLRIGLHMYNMNLVGIYVNKSNKTIYDQIIYNFGNFNRNNESILKKLRSTKIKKTTLSLCDFLSEKVVIDYTTMKKSEREAINAFFNRNQKLYCKYNKFGSLLNLQYRKIQTRLQLFDSAKAAVEILAGFGLPDPCTEGIIRHLLNDDLRSLIKVLFDFRNAK